jgi:hypothetical protein
MNMLTMQILCTQRIAMRLPPVMMMGTDPHEREDLTTRWFALPTGFAGGSAKDPVPICPQAVSYCPART